MRLLSVLAFGLCGWLAVGEAAQPKPNIIFILADDLGWADVSGGHTTYGGGSDFYETPNVSRLASEGMCFSSAYVCQNCVPTRAAILSGQYPTRTGVYNVGTLNRNVVGTTPLIGPENHQDVPASHLDHGRNASRCRLRHVSRGQIPRGRARGGQRDVAAEPGIRLQLRRHFGR